VTAILEERQVDAADLPAFMDAAWPERAPAVRRPARNERDTLPEPTPDSLGIYLSQIAAAPLLTPVQEVSLGRRAQAGERAAVDALVQHNLRLVVSVATKYQHLGVALPDLIQEGSVGLLHAAERFDPSRGFRFSTYAIWWIRQAVLRALSEQSRLVRLPEYLLSQIARINQAREALREQLDRQPTDAELATEAALPLEQVAALAQANRPVASLDAPVSEDGDLALGDLISADGPGLEEMAEIADRRAAVARALDGLSEREREVIRLRYGLDGRGRECTLEEVARQFSVSRERIRHLEVRALRRLRSGEEGLLLRRYMEN
jgi:RNA polymerase primary sigma factor